MFDMFTSWLTESALGDVVSDTLVGAATGALVGGAASALTGGDFGDGAKKGAIGGAVVGGGMSLYDNKDAVFGLQDNSIPKLGENTEVPTFSGTSKTAPTQTGNTSEMQKFHASPQEDQGLLERMNDKISKMTPQQAKLYGGLASGVGKGLFNMQASKDAEDLAEKEYQRLRQLEQERYNRNKLKIQPGLLANRSVAPRYRT